LISDNPRQAFSAPSDQWIDLYQIDLDQQNADLNVLSDDERQRAEKHRSNHYAVMRTVMRSILGQLLNLAPSEVPIWIEDGGKPYLAERNFEFNLSHTGRYGLIAISQLPLGVDIERFRPQANRLAIAKRVMPEDAIARIEAAEDSDCIFYEEWTQLEARHKCTGIGIFDQLDPDIELQHAQLKLPSDLMGCVAWPRQASAPKLAYHTIT
jgi:4'-phosphopantetheinyl transferase